MRATRCLPSLGVLRITGHHLKHRAHSHKLAALSSLFEHLSEVNAVAHNPVKGVKRPKVRSYDGKTPALGDAQARHLLKLPAGDGLKARRDRALLSLLLYHGLRREELCKPMRADCTCGAVCRT